MSNGLRHAAACPSFQRLLNAAADGALARQRKRARPVTGLHPKAG